MGSDAGTPGGRRPVALVTGVGRSIGIGAASTRIAATLGEAGARAVDVQADLSDPTTPATVYDLVEERLGPVTALVMCHCESVDSGLLDTTVDSFDRHFAVNARATWLLVREHGRRFTAPA